MTTAAMMQVFHFLKIRSEIRGPSFHGPSFCISFKTRRTSRPYAVVFPVCAVSLVRRALGRLAVVVVMAMVLTNFRRSCTPSLRVSPRIACWKLSTSAIDPKETFKEATTSLIGSLI